MVIQLPPCQSCLLYCLSTSLLSSNHKSQIPVFSPILFPIIKIFCLHPLLPSYPCSLPYLASTTSPMRPLSCTITVPLVPLCYLPSSRLLELATLRLSLASRLLLSCVTPLSLLLRPLATWMPAARASTLPVSPFLPPF